MSARAACLHLLIHVVYVEANLLAALVCLSLYTCYSRFHLKRSRVRQPKASIPNTSWSRTPWLSVSIPIQATVSSWVNQKPILSWRPPVDFVRHPPSKRRALSMPRRRRANQLSTSNFAALGPSSCMSPMSKRMVEISAVTVAWKTAPHCTHLVCGRRWHCSCKGGTVLHDRAA